MPYRGHVENGVVVLDEPVALREGIQVSVELLCSNEERPDTTLLRGTEYRFDDPFTPVVPDSDWDVLR